MNWSDSVSSPLPRRVVSLLEIDPCPHPWSASSSDIKNNTPVSGSSLIPFSIPTSNEYVSFSIGWTRRYIRKYKKKKKEEKNFVIQNRLKKRRKPNYLLFVLSRSLGVRTIVCTLKMVQMFLSRAWNRSVRAKNLNETKMDKLKII